MQLWELNLKQPPKAPIWTLALLMVLLFREVRWGSFKTPDLDTISGSLRPWRWYLAWVLGGVYPLPFSFSLSASWSVKTQPAPTSINIMSFLLWWTLLLTRSHASVENFVSDGKSNITTPDRTSSEIFMHWTNTVTKLCVKWESPTR